MKSLLITGWGTHIKVNNRRLIIQNKEIHQEFYPHQIDYDTIIIDGHTGNITFEAIRWITKHGISTPILNWNGNLLADILPPTTKNGVQRIKQYEKSLSPRHRKLIASTIIDEKIRQSTNLLEALSPYYDIDVTSFKKSIKAEAENYLERVPEPKYINNLMLYEGRLATLYWQELSKIFNQLYPEFNFQSRKNKTYSWNMNASDEINALLNYGYSILECLLRKNVNAVGLDLTIGFLHETTYGKTALVYDLQELYRWLIDLSVIELLEEKKLKKSDFIVTENYHIRLKPDTARMLIEKIERNLNKKASYKHKNYSYESIMAENIQGLANYIADKADKLKFEIPLFELNRNDCIEVRDALANMTPEERKKLGINKSTLWYIQKNIRDGKKIKLYDKVKLKVDI
jgi:CRISPR-associated protein Cas1